MTDIPVQSLVKCPMLFEHEPCDLVPVKTCRTCQYLRGRYFTKVECNYEELNP